MLETKGLKAMFQLIQLAASRYTAFLPSILRWASTHAHL
jgi:hypothetical protein